MGDAVNQPPGSPAVHDLVPMAHVADVERSMAFYALLGFTPVNTMSWSGRLGWAFLASGSGRLMLNVANAPVDPGVQAVLFYCYTCDLVALRAHLSAHGVAHGPISFPAHMPEGELRLTDPDGYVILVGQLAPGN